MSWTSLSGTSVPSFVPLKVRQGSRRRLPAAAAGASLQRAGAGYSFDIDFLRANGHDAEIFGNFDPRRCI